MSSANPVPSPNISPEIAQKLQILHAENDKLTRQLKKNWQMLDHYRQAVDNSPNAIFSINRKGLITTWNPACTSLFDYDAEIIGRHFGILLYGSEQETFIEEEVLRKGEDRALSNLDLVYRCRSGDRREMVSRIYPVTNALGIVHGFVFANTDVTERNRIHRELEGYRHHLEELVEERTEKLREEVRRRREAQLALQASYDALVTILDGLDLAIRVVALGGGETVFANSRLKTFEEQGRLKQRGYQLFSGLTTDTPQEEGIAMEQANPIASQRTSFDPVLERWFIFQERIIDWVNGRPVRLQVAADITERKQIDLERQRMEKLESLGVLAGGIAHDFNNLLTGIMGSLSLLQFQAEQGAVDTGLIENAVKASSRATSLTQQLLTFSKGGDPVCKVIDVGEVLRESVSFSLRGANIRCDIDIAADLSAIDADEGQLSHVFHNLAINAKQAMEGGGRLLVTAADSVLLENQVADLPEGNYVRIDFSDTGPGISPENLDKVFDPYFTTKKSGEGLGLAMVHTIINKHHGKIAVRPNPDQGVTFTVYLPISGNSPASQVQAAEEYSPHGGHILLMDDEETIRDVGAAMLGHLGYHVVTVADGLEAIRRYQGAYAKQPFDIVILDLTIPGGMGGEEAASRLAAIDPEVRIIASSGYADSPVLSDFRRFGFSGVLKKPYRLEEMRTVVGTLLQK